MSEERLIQILLSPHISEKSSRLGDAHNQYVFKVIKTATKPEVKAAVEKMFKVEVESVQTCNLKGKIKGARGNFGQRPGVKKAYVRLKAGSNIDFVGGQ